VQPFVAEGAGAIGPGERHDDQISGFDGSHVGPHRFDYADGLMPHDTTGDRLGCVRAAHGLYTRF
jgi:hypothetical protein